MHRLAMAAIAVLMLAGCAETSTADAEKKAAGEAQRLAAALAGHVPGKAQSCITSRDTSGPESYGDSTLLFRDGRTIYRTETSGSCRGAGRDTIFVTHLYGSELCRGDIARLVERSGGFFAGSCAMGDFVPYRKE